MPVCIVHKTNKTENAVLVDSEKRTLLFRDKFAAKVFLANQGIYCMIGYEFHEVEIKPKEETADATAEPTA